MFIYVEMIFIIGVDTSCKDQEAQNLADALNKGESKKAVRD